MSRFLGFISVVAISVFASITDASAADEFKLSNNQRIACGRGLNAGKLQNIKCNSYAFIFNTRTSLLSRVTATLTRQR